MNNIIAIIFTVIVVIITLKSQNNMSETTKKVNVWDTYVLEIHGKMKLMKKDISLLKWKDVIRSLN